MPVTVPVLIHESQFPQTLERELQQALACRRIDPKFHYGTPRQARAWLALHQACSPALADPDCVGVYEAAFRAVTKDWPDAGVHVISLGSGGAHKEARLVRQLRQAVRPVRVTLADASPALVVHAHQTICAAAPEAAVSAVVLDLITTGDLEGTLCGEAPEDFPRLITCFGVLPNAEPGDIFPRLASLLRPGDRLLLSANLAGAPPYARAVPKVLPLYDNALTRDWLMLLLQDCGFERGDGEFHFGVESCPGFPNLLQIVARWQLLRDRVIRPSAGEITFCAGDCLRLFYSNRYTESLVRRAAAPYGLRLESAWITRRQEEGVFAAVHDVS